MLIDEKQLKVHFDGDEELISELLDVFASSYPETLNALKQSLSEGNIKDTELHAHTLKGMVSNFFAQELKDAASEIEKMAREGSVSGEAKFVEALETGLPKMIEDVKKVL
jgi:protein-histidine pros-kinase